MTTMMKRGGLALVMVALATLAVPERAWATPLPVGGTVTPPQFGQFSGAVVADTGAMFYALSPGPGTGTVRELVIADAMNPFGAGDFAQSQHPRRRRRRAQGQYRDHRRAACPAAPVIFVPFRKKP